MAKSLNFWASRLLPTLGAAALLTVSCAGGQTAGTGTGGTSATTGGSSGTASGGSMGNPGSGGAKSGGASGTASGGASGTASGGATGTSSGGSGFGSGGSGFGTASGGAPVTGTGTGGAPVTGGALTVTAGYATNGTFKGYGYTFTGPMTGSKATISPADFKTATSLCASGMITADSTYASVAGMGMNVNQEIATTAAEPTAATVATSGTGLNINVSATGLTLMPGAGSQLRAQVKTAAGDYCAPIPAAGAQVIPWAMFNKTCWNTSDAGAAVFAAGTAIKAVELVVPSSTAMIGPFMICLLDAK